MKIQKLIRIVKKKKNSSLLRHSSYNHGNNILELYNVLVQIRFTTSKRNLDIWYSKLSIRVAERLKTQDLKKIGNIRKILNLGGHITQGLVSLQELRLCQQQLKKTQKQIPNFSFPVQFYWITLFCSKYFVRLSLSKQIFDPYSAQSSSNSNFWTFFVTPKHFNKLQ